MLFIKSKIFLQTHPSHALSLRKTIPVLLIMAIGLILIVLFPSPEAIEGFKDYLPLHMMLETISIVIAMQVAGLGWNAYNSKVAGNILFLASIFFGVAILDFSHLLSYAGMPNYVTPSSPDKSISFWLAARLLSAIGLLIFSIFQLSSFANKTSRYLLLTSVFGLVGFINWLLLFHNDWFPHLFFVAGQGLTPLKINTEYTIIAFNIITASILWWRMHRPQSSHSTAPIFAAVCIMAMSEFFFTLYADVTDIYNIFGHMYKAIAYIFIYRAIYISNVQKPYEELNIIQNQLHEKNRLLDNIIENIPHMIFLKHASDLRYVLFNRAGEKLTGYSQSTLLEHNDYDFFPKDQADFFIQKDRETLQNGIIVDIPEEPIETPHGVRILHTKKIPINDAHGQPQYLLGISEDITEQKQIKDALHEIEEAFHSTFNQAAVGIAHISLDGHWLEMNRKFCDIIGYTKEELLKLTFQTITYPEDLPGDLEYIQHMISGEIETYNIEKRYIHKTGKLVWINLTVSLVRDHNGSVKYFIKVIEDISLRKEVEIALLESEKNLQESQRVTRIGSYVLDVRTGTWTSSEVLDQLFGIDKTYERSITGWKAIVHPDEQIEMEHYLKNEVIAKHKLFDQEYRIVRKEDQSVHWVHGLGKLEFDSNGTPLKMVGTIQDITKQKLSSDALLKLSLAVEQSPNSIVITDLTGKIEYVNRMFTTITGYSKEEAIGQNPSILKSEETPQSTYDDMWAHLTRGDTWHGELINRRKDQKSYIEWATISPVKQTDGTITNYVAIKEDITKRKTTEAHIEKLAHFDQLTGLANRVMLNDRIKYLLNRAQRNNEPLTVMFLDLDHFKNINDSLGHTIGDKVLIEVANRIKTAVRDEDTVARLGGDEFIMLFPNTDSNSAMHIATKLITAISKSTMIEHNELTITPSIGIAIYPDDGEDFETLLKNADTAMYRVKSDSRNSFHFFTQEMQLNLMRNLQMENALRHALERNELEVYYQPQVSLSDGHIIGAEALLRWHHPELGMISPAEFIPIAESSGQIIEIGEWVLRTAIQQTKSWTDDGFNPMIIAINLSAIQFRQKNLLTLVTDILEEVQLPPEYLELELTEAVTMHDPETVIGVMNRFHAQGIRMSIDDFGTGYSSLSYLKQFKVYKLKIDQSFIRDISDDPDDRAIVSAIIDMAHNLGLQTIAEGVETAEQLAFLRLHGCNEVQGYYFSKPLPSVEFKQFLQNHPKE